MSIIHINTDLRETHLVGAQTREWLVSPLLCPALAPHGILLAGLTEAGPGFRFVRPTPRWNQLLVCLSGSGFVWLDGQWMPCKAGTAYLTPAGVLHAYQAELSARWELAWVQSSEDWLRLGDMPKLLTVEPAPLAAALAGLRREMQEAADLSLLPSWSLLVAAYARRLLGPVIGDARFRRLWEDVAADLSQPWTIESLAAHVGVSGEHLRRLCRRHLGRSPMSHVTNLRMRQAMALLASESYTVETVARHVGYDNPFAFSAAFKRHEGISPSEYRQMAHAPQPRRPLP